MIFLAATVLTLALVAAFWALFSFSHALGALLGGAMVVVDVLIFRRYVAKVKPGPQASPLWKVVVKFYLVSFANIIFCFLVIKFGIGAPLAFLAGLGVFLPALIVGLILNAVTLKLKSGDIVAGEEPAAGYTAGGAGEAPVASDGAGDGAAIGKSVGHGG
jgi:hypothetical protein